MCTENIDMVKFQKGLELLPKNLHYIWYPTIDNVHPDSSMRKRMYPYLKIINEILSPLWLSAGYSRPQTPLPTTWSIISQEFLRRLNREKYVNWSMPLLFPIYCYGPKTKWWEDEQVPHVINSIPSGDIAIIYPGYVYWLESSKKIVDLISPENK